jgi:glycosyltransferase involved in cell wall biosynthesis
MPTPGVLTVFWNSNVMASKGFFDLADAVRQVRDDGFPVRIVSVGQPRGDSEMNGREVARRFHALLVHEWLDYRGSVDQALAIKMAAEADVICLPSRSEAQGIAIIEGMCAGKALVVSDIPALRATVGDYPAWFVPVRSVEAIAEALRELCRRKQMNPAAFAGSLKEAAAAARERFSAERFDRDMAAILRLELAAE